MNPEARRAAMREKLLSAALAHVPFDGWTRTALQTGARETGLAATTVLELFPGGPAEALELFNTLADRRMVAALEARDPAATKVRARIAAAVRLRLEANARHREAIRQGLSFLALPPNLALAARLLYLTVDAIWYAAGDRSTDHNFYTKRGLLAGVYGATLLYWLNDRSEGFHETWAFLDRRIAEVLRIPQALGRVGQFARKLPDPFRLFAGRARR